MPGTRRRIDALPDEFGSEDEAASFWDTHSLGDYVESLEDVELDVRIKRRHFEIEVDEPSFLALCRSAREQRKPLKELASEILKQALTSA